MGRNTCMCSVSQGDNQTGKKKMSRAWNFILVCVTRTNKIYQGQKENTETAENQFCRLFIFHSLASILAKHGSDNDPKTGTEYTSLPGKKDAIKFYLTQLPASRVLEYPVS